MNALDIDIDALSDEDVARLAERCAARRSVRSAVVTPEPKRRVALSGARTRTAAEPRTGGDNASGAFACATVLYPEPTEEFVDAFRAGFREDTAREAARTFFRPEMFAALGWLDPRITERLRARQEAAALTTEKGTREP